MFPGTDLSQHGAGVPAFVHESRDLQWSMMPISQFNFIARKDPRTKLGNLFRESTKYINDHMIRHLYGFVDPDDFSDRRNVRPFSEKGLTGSRRGHEDFRSAMDRVESILSESTVPFFVNVPRRIEKRTPTYSSFYPRLRVSGGKPKWTGKPLMYGSGIPCSHCGADLKRGNCCWSIKIGLHVEGDGEIATWAHMDHSVEVISVLRSFGDVSGATYESGEKMLLPFGFFGLDWMVQWDICVACHPARGGLTLVNDPGTRGGLEVYTGGGLTLHETQPSDPLAS